MKIEELAKKYKIRFIVLFGSQATGSPRKDSDFDIAVFMDKFNDLDTYNDVLFGLEKILEVPAEKIDLTNLKTSDPLLRHEITSKGKLLFGNELEYLEFKAFSFRDYIESRKLLDLESFLVKKRHKLLGDALNKYV